ncbi:DUF2953 domain-containing protein [Paenibacillus medicaginis]|uniref:DUF2953 domain-containing protein n=1 Tax=Paenibacillus medicaginis TaxID=1470560 RepID=A0ABV5C6D3_9BACL
MKPAVWIWIVIAALIIIILAVLLSRVKIHAEVLKQANNDYARLQVHMLYGLVRFQYELPSVVIDRFRKGIWVRLDRYVNVGEDKADKEDAVVDKGMIEEMLHNIRLLLANTVSLKQWINKTVAHISLSHLEWTTKLGVKDCSQTAVLIGVVWALKSSVVGWTTGHVRYDCAPALSVIPSWDERNYFSMNVVCSASISMAYVMISLIRLLAGIFKVPGGFKAWKKVFTRESSGHISEH